MARVFLHICCGPCSIMPVQRIREKGHEPFGWFHNPNIQPLKEYLARREAVEKCSQKLGLELDYDDRWDIAAWLKTQQGAASREARCENCCSMRLYEAAKAAKKAGFSLFSTSLLYSRYQPHDFIRRTGVELANEFGLEFLYQDFREDWQAGIDLSRKWEIYRQAWCGCVFSEAERYAKKLDRLGKNAKSRVDSQTQ